MAEGLTSPARWAVPAGAATVDPSLDGVARTRVTWATNPNRRITCAPFYLPGTQEIDWEGYPADLNCTMTAPTEPLDPDADPSVSAGQCCDPLGAGTNGLPACNAFRIVSEFAAGAAEITGAPANELAPVCL